MVVGRDTFTGDLLARLGLVNVFADGAGADGTQRYPHVSVSAIRERRPDLVLLPDEPYCFTATDGPEAIAPLPYALVDGRALTWYGPSLLTAADRVAHALTAASGPAADRTESR
jgi:hypothetical protein